MFLPLLQQHSSLFTEQLATKMLENCPSDRTLRTCPFFEKQPGSFKGFPGFLAKLFLLECLLCFLVFLQISENRGGRRLPRVSWQQLRILCADSLLSKRAFLWRCRCLSKFSCTLLFFSSLSMRCTCLCRNYRCVHMQRPPSTHQRHRSMCNLHHPHKVPLHQLKLRTCFHQQP